MTDLCAPMPVSRHAITLVLIAVFLDMVGFGLIMPVLPALIEEVGQLRPADAVCTRGICGSSCVIANACIADVTAPEDRAKASGPVGAAFGVRFIPGPAIGGMPGELGPRGATGGSVLQGWGSRRWWRWAMGLQDRWRSCWW